MSVELRLSDPRAGSNLLDFLDRNGVRAVLEGERLILESEGQPADRQLREVTLLVRIWQVVNPDQAVEITRT